MTIKTPLPPPIVLLPEKKTNLLLLLIVGDVDIATIQRLEISLYALYVLF